MTIGAVNGSTVWKDELTDVPRRYMAFRWNDVLRPIPLGAVGNSNVHGLTSGLRGGHNALSSAGGTL